MSAATPRPAAPGVPTTDLRSLQQAICARVRDFEIGALLDLLATMGYRPADICFRAHLAESPQPTLLHHIEFTDPEGTVAGPALPGGSSVELASIAELAAETIAAPPPRRRGPGPSPAVAAFRAGGPRSQVTVTVNLGLLSCRSPLPSYFQQLLSDLVIREPLIELLRFIDRNLLHARLTCDRPEHLVERWDQITSDLLRIHGLDSLVGLGWLFRHVFPELPVRVERTAERLRVPYASARLNLSALGSACLGGVTRIDVHDFQVTLRAEESLLRPGLPWVREADRRLRAIVFPALEPVVMNLTVVLELEDDRAMAVLSDGAGPLLDSYLGMDPLGRSGDRGLPVRRVILYRGYLPRDVLDLDRLEDALAAGARATLSAADRARRAAPPAPGDETVATQLRTEPDVDREFVLSIDHRGRLHRFRTAVRWGARAWFRDEPYAIELHGDGLDHVAADADAHPRVWRLLRDRARDDLTAEVSAAALARYDADTVTEEMVADLLARGDDAALHALLTYGGARDVTSEAWERFLRGSRQS